MTFHLTTDKKKKWDAMWLALEEQKVFADANHNKGYKKQHKVKIIRCLDQEALENTPDRHKQLYLHKLNEICSDPVTFQDIRISRWDHLRKELHATNAYFFKKFPEEYYDYSSRLDFCSYKHNRKLNDAVIEEYPGLEQFKKPYYDIFKVFNRDGRLMYFLAQNSRPFVIPHKAAAKNPFGNAEFTPDQSLEANILNYFVISLLTEPVIQIQSNDFNNGCMAPIYCGKYRIGRIHLNPFGELLLMCETVQPGDDSHDFIVKCNHSSKETSYAFKVHRMRTMKIIATIRCKVWALKSTDLSDERMFGLFFKENVNIIDKTLVFGAAIVIVHEYHKILWNGTLSDYNSIGCGACLKCKFIKAYKDLDFKYTLPKTPSKQLLNNSSFECNEWKALKAKKKIKAIKQAIVRTFNYRQ